MNKPISSEEEKEWGKKCSRLSTMILKGEFINKDDVLLELIQEKFTKKELAVCTHQYIIEQTIKRVKIKQKQKENNDIIYG